MLGTFEDNSFMEISKALRVCGDGGGAAGGVDRRQQPQRKGSEDYIRERSKSGTRALRC